MPRVLHFEIHATDPDQLMAFYSGLFGWAVKEAARDGLLADPHRAG